MLLLCWGFHIGIINGLIWRLSFILYFIFEDFRVRSSFEHFEIMNILGVCCSFLSSFLVSFLLCFGFVVFFFKFSCVLGIVIYLDIY